MIQSIKKFISAFFIKTQVVNPESTDLVGKTIVITGASRGIGLAIAELVAKQGASVVAIARNKDELEAAYKDIPNATLISADISNSKDIERAAELIHKIGAVDVLINNAGIFSDKALEDILPEEFDKVVAVNLKGIFLMTRALLPQMKKNSQGFIINIGSKISHNTNISPHKVLYAMSKYAVEGFSFALNKELKGTGVRVSCLMPGTVNTFVSTKSKEYLSPYELAFFVVSMIKMPEVDFESIVIKSVHQNI